MSFLRSVGSRSGIVFVMALALALTCLASKQFVMPTAKPAKTYPAHDEHPAEAVAVGADPYDA